MYRECADSVDQSKGAIMCRSGSSIVALTPIAWTLTSFSGRYRAADDVACGTRSHSKHFMCQRPGLIG